MSDVLKIEVDGPVETVTLDRPGSLNALNPALVAALSDHFEALKSRHEVRVVLLRGAGRAFCAGLDLKGWNLGPAASPQQRLANQVAIGDVVQAMRGCPQPIIALGHGAACGGGFSLMLASDVRFGAPSLRMNAAYIKIGLGGCDIGASYFLPRLIGASAAAEYLLTGRFMDADTAYRLNLLSAIHPEEELRDAGRLLAEQMLSNAPMGLRLTKQAMNINLDAPSLAAAMALEDRQQILLTQTEDHGEAVKAFLDKRDPDFSDR